MSVDYWRKKNKWKKFDDWFFVLVLERIMEVGFGDEGELFGKIDGIFGIDFGYNLWDDVGGG